ncbi:MULTISPECIES: hypothetical protein [Streptomyces]|uniref:MarR family transcriptional regulator n=1 Tax=Streptomyces dengpaensis TaxID=2049881 RepID=A0ABN5HY72_9ACTN|nr:MULTISPECIES: hypothetical protein [Streptomyces]AVH55693.1 hypothetical protein C4B68_07790 [Streptomyces dengpaensis]PIB11955.1 hypothetical protein B1C81_01750 [Streptomyces sp. HG99]
MTTPPAESLLFDVPTPVERLLHLAGQYTRHNDALDLHLRAATEPEPHAHAASAQRLAADTRMAVRAIHGQRLYKSTELAETVARLKQLAFLSAASADHGVQVAHELTALAPETAVGCAVSLAADTRRRRGASIIAPGVRLTSDQHSALAQIACGHVVASSSLGREFTRSREPKVLMSILRTLESKGLAERTPNSALPAYRGGPPQDRVRLTPAGITALAVGIAAACAARSPGSSPVAPAAWSPPRSSTATFAST